ncbi:TPA: hypothetical protein ENS27_14205 [bacterium]|nr:hypothetical protein [bacterium]
MNPVLKSLIKFLYPAQCHHCKENLDPTDHYICKSCWEQSEFIKEPVCQTCGYPIGFTDKTSDERPNDVWFRKARSIANYYEHDKISLTDYIMNDKPNNSCNRCPKDVKPLFSIDLYFHNELNRGAKGFIKLKSKPSKELSSAFGEYSSKAFIMVDKIDYGWQLIDGDREFLLRRDGEKINVYGINPIHPFENKADYQEKSISAISNAIHLLKYGGKTIMAEPLARLMIENMPRLLNKDDYDFIIPLPMYKNKLRKRGYNQVELIGRRLSKAIGIPLDTTSLIKIMETESQASSPFMKRGINLKGAFDVSDKSKIEGKRILLIDDVMTSGASMNESAKALMTKGGVEFVDVLTLVRAV